MSVRWRRCVRAAVHGGKNGNEIRILTLVISSFAKVAVGWRMNETMSGKTGGASTSVCFRLKWLEHVSIGERGCCERP